MSQPLAARIRPTNLKEFVGQEHLVGKADIRKILDEPNPSPVQAGLPARHGQADEGDARTAAMTEENGARNKAGEPPGQERPKILFLDEIYRFNKAQQDFLLPDKLKGKKYFT